jgi:hypothetical protein
MMKIYELNITNDHLSLLAPTKEAISLEAIFNNTRPLLKDWKIIDFEFKAFRRSGKKRPDLRLLGGGLAFRAELKDLIFPKPCQELEFLPIRASGEDWLVTNCLKTTKHFDHHDSVVYAFPDGMVYMIIHLVIEDTTLDRCEIFVLENSNRATLLVLPSFVERITRLGLEGIQFKEIGVLNEPQANS